jgi:hypothetical protein
VAELLVGATGAEEDEETQDRKAHQVTHRSLRSSPSRVTRTFVVGPGNFKCTHCR